MKKDVDYLETFYEVTSFIESQNEIPDSKVQKLYSERGRGGLWELAEELTDEFQTLNIDREWDGEFFEELDKFLTVKTN